MGYIFCIKLHGPIFIMLGARPDFIFLQSAEPVWSLESRIGHQKLMPGPLEMHLGSPTIPARLQWKKCHILLSSEKKCFYGMVSPGVVCKRGSRKSSLRVPWGGNHFHGVPSDSIFKDRAFLRGKRFVKGQTRSLWAPCGVYARSRFLSLKE